jgi:hypothetical protein
MPYTTKSKIVLNEGTIVVSRFRIARPTIFKGKSEGYIQRIYKSDFCNKYMVSIKMFDDDIGAEHIIYACRFFEAYYLHKDNQGE